MKNMKNENAVSPVIGVILMVVITVIIAAILAVFAFGVGAPAKAPEVNLKYVATFDGATGNASLKISHEGGDALILKDEKMNVVLASDGTTAAIAGTPPVALDVAGGWQTTALNTLAAGQSITGDLDTGVVTGAGVILEVSIVDTPTGQMISKTRVVVQ